MEETLSGLIELAYAQPVAAVSLAGFFAIIAMAIVLLRALKR